ncbi:MAG TPA: type I polyketide synthase [Micromonosporaceae bacterium]
MYEDDAIVDPTSSIAVVGMAGRFPQAPDIEAFWRLLNERGDAIRPVPADRWDAGAQLDPEKHIQDVGGFLDDVDLFDPGFFGISPREAEDVDPQQRLMLEIAWRALEDAGKPAAALRGTRTGVYVGASWHDYEILRKDRGAGATPHSAVGNALDVIAARVSYFLKLTGPSLVVETGCSSSLVALHLAASALVAGDIDGALVGGVNLILAPDVSIGLTHFGGLSPDGRCKAFAASANGFVRAECVAGLYLKRLDRALADGDPIRAVILRTVVNNDGGGESLVTPNPEGQEDLLRRAYQGLGLPLERLRYIEAHGTGTGRGDPIEAGAIGRVLGRAQDRSADPLAIGSVKTNIGHTEAAAGLAGLVKVILALQHRMVPPSLHSAELNPAIDFDALNLRVVREPLALPSGEPVYAGVNSFGWGGTNAHVVLATPPARAAREEGHPNRLPALLPVSAHSPDALRQRVGDIRDLLAGAAQTGGDGSHPGTAEVAETLAHRRDHFPHRVAVLAPDRDTALARLDAYRADPDADVDGVFAGRAEPVGRTAFVFPGQGSQWAGMGARLYAEHPTFAEVVRRCARALRPHVDWDLVEVVSGAAGADWLSRVDVVQPTLWAVSVGLAELWREAGVHPDVVVGHSQGEVSAATVAGMLSYEDAAMVVAKRSELALRASGKGRMLAVSLTPEQARQALEGFEELVSLAVNNGPTSCVLSGDTEAVLALKELLEADDVFCRLVDVDYASHCSQMDALTPDLVRALAGVRPVKGNVELVSTVRVAPLEGPELDAAYWADNLRRPVLFQDTMNLLFDRGVTHVVEVSPHPVLVTALEQLAEARNPAPRILSTLRRDQGTPADLTAAFARGYVAGLAPFGPPTGANAPVPGYPWQRSRFWPDKARRRPPRIGLEVTLTPSATEQDLWQAGVELGIDTHPWLDDHRVHDAVVVPGAAMLALILATGRARTGRNPSLLSDVEFRSDLTLAGDAATVDLLWRDDVSEGGSVSLLSLAPDGSGWTTHATARAQRPAVTAPPPPFPVDLLDGSATSADDFYAACDQRGLRYGPAFRGVLSLRVADERALGEVELPARCRAGVTPNTVHPALWDAALQVSLAVLPGDTTVVPVGVERVEVYDDLAEPLTAGWSAATRRADGRVDVTLFDAERRPVLGMVGLALRELDTAGDVDPDAGRLYRLRFRPAPRRDVDAATPATRRVVVCGSGDVAAVARAVEATTGGVLVAAGVPGVADGDRLRAVPDLTDVLFLAPTAADGLAAQRRALGELADQVRACLTLASPPRIVVVTTCAQAVLPGERPDPGAALFWGFTRVLRREHPELTPTVVDVAAGDGLVQLGVEVAAGEPDDQVVLRGDQRFAARLVAGGVLEEDEEEQPRWRGPAQPFRLVPARPGRWDGLEFRPLRRRLPGPGEVEIEVTATALNFIDVMKAMGTYPDPVGATLLGGECVGRVTAVGPDTPGPRIGDRVAACVFGTMSSHVTVDASHVRPVPADMSDADAAALPLVTTTAWYGLAELARLGPGETVLIHSAAGGLGLAAINVARYLGAEVIATAGSEAKRAYLRELGIKHVFDSRDLSWAREVVAATSGRGVDVVLNSLTGAAITLGLQVLAEDGRFVEVGKKDIYAGRTITMESFRKGISLAAVDLAGLMARRPERFARLFTEVWRLVEAGELGRLPVLPYRFADAAEAMRTMARGDHIGKFVLTDPATVDSVAPEPMQDGRFRSDGTYVVTGGLGALGLSLAEFVAARGGGALALLGRSAPKPDAQARIDALRAAGTPVRVYQVDVTDRDAVAGALADIRAGLPPVRGVVHAAGLLDDATIANLRPEQIGRVVGPKVDGARHLDELTDDDPLDLFVLFSSAAALVGNAGQAAYAAGNAYLDALAQARRHRGRPALSVQWGPFAEVGLAAQDDLRGDRLAERGMGSFGVDEAWAALSRFLTDGAPSVVGYVPLDLRRWFDAYPDTAALPSWRELRHGGGSGGGPGDGGQFLQELRAAVGDARTALVEGKVREVAGRVLRIEPAGIERDTPLKALGLDSLMGLELRNRLEAAFNLRLSPTLLWTYGTCGALTSALCERLGAETVAGQPDQSSDGSELL